MNIFTHKQLNKKIALHNELVKEYEDYKKLEKIYYDRYIHNSLLQDLKCYKEYAQKVQNTLEEVYKLRKWFIKHGVKMDPVQ